MVSCGIRTNKGYVETVKGAGLLGSVLVRGPLGSLKRETMKALV